MTATTESSAVGVTVAKSDLARALKAAASIKAKHVMLDLSESPAVNAFTREVAVRAPLDAQSDGDHGVGFVLRTAMAKLMPYIGNAVRLSVADDQVTIVDDESTFEIKTTKAAPPMPAGTTSSGERYRWESEHAHLANTYGHDFDVESHVIAEFEAPTLVEILKRVLPFSSPDETRPILRAVAFWPAASLAGATDSYRLALVRWGDGPDDPADDPLLVHAPAVAAIQQMVSRKLGTVTISQADTRLLVDFDDIRWSVTKLVGDYPKLWSMIPDGFETTLKVDREDLLTASRAAAVVAPGSAPLRLDVGDAIINPGVTITASQADHGAMSRRLRSAEADGPGMEIGLNPGFVAAVCAVAPVERLTLHLISPLRPMLFEAARDRYLLMPIRLNFS